MLKLYHAPISPNSRRIWITLLEKGLEFELVEVNLEGEQLKPEFLAMNPFHHVPVLEDDGFHIVESIAILDYLEAKYPAPAMLPKNVQDLAIARMVQMVTITELLPAIIPLTPLILDFPGGDAEKIAQAQQKASTVLKFFEELLDDRPYFGSENITLAEPVAGTLVPWLAKADVSFSEFPKLSAWRDRLLARPSWQATEVPLDALKTRMAARMAQQKPG